jgi:hypothetical protein
MDTEVPTAAAVNVTAAKPVTSTGNIGRNRAGRSAVSTANVKPASANVLVSQLRFLLSTRSRGVNGIRNSVRMPGPS